MQPRRIALYSVVTAACAIHAVSLYLLRRQNSDANLAFSLIVYFWSISPYIFCIFAAKLFGEFTPPTVAAAIALLLDVMFQIDLANSKSSTAAVGLIFTPLWNLIIVFPSVVVLGHWLIRRGRSVANVP